MLMIDNMIEIEDDTVAVCSRTSPIRGKPKSGRVWKNVQTNRHTSMMKDKDMHRSWAKKMLLRDERKAVKAMSDALKQAKEDEKQRRRERRAEQKQRQLVNERKAEVVQVIRNTAKLKRMKKKHLRFIQKRDTTAVPKGDVV